DFGARSTRNPGASRDVAHVDGGRLAAIPVELRSLGPAVHREGALGTHGIGALEDPVLPSGEPREDLALHGFRTREAHGGFHPREWVRGQARSLLDRNAYVVLPVDLVGCNRDQAEGVGLAGCQGLAVRQDVLGVSLV